MEMGIYGNPVKYITVDPFTGKQTEVLTIVSLTQYLPNMYPVVNKVMNYMATHNDKGTQLAENYIRQRFGDRIVDTVYRKMIETMEDGKLKDEWAETKDFCLELLNLYFFIFENVQALAYYVQQTN